LEGGLVASRQLRCYRLHTYCCLLLLLLILLRCRRCRRLVRLCCYCRPLLLLLGHASTLRALFQGQAAYNRHREPKALKGWQTTAD
jgi:hypothetical protein